MPVPMRSWLPLLVLATTSCTPVEPPTSSAPPPSVEQPPVLEAEPEPQAELAPAPVSEAALALAAIPWRWRSPRPAGELEYWIPMPVSIASGSTVIEASEHEPSGVRVTRKDAGRERWSVILGERRSNSAALARVGDAVLVAHYHGIATGTEVARLDLETGKVLWNHPLRGVGPVGHSKYHNAVELEIEAGVLQVYGLEAFGAYVERVDVERGETLEHAMVPAELAGLRWHFPERAPGRMAGGLTIDDGAGGWLSIEGRPARVVHRPARGEGFSLPLGRDPGSCGIGDGLVRDGVAYLVHACSITSGAEVYAISLRDGTVRWQGPVHGLGPIAHSAYSNDVRLEWRDGVLLVFGDEAMGDYVEAIEPSTGRTLVTKSWPVG
ncbi:MAG: PQQ-like beta-propeller repeat protein [Myxococcales bacterium]|nr:PQQ-like beta-propeller repeat protein [Myxococcales bacterium]